MMIMHQNNLIYVNMGWIHIIDGAHIFIIIIKYICWWSNRGNYTGDQDL